MVTRLFKLPVCGFKSLDKTIWVNAPTADMLIEVLFPMIEARCDTLPDRETLLIFLEQHYPLKDSSLSLIQLADMIYLFYKKEQE